MAKVLENWVLELKLLSVDHLGPVGMHWVGKEPTFVVLGLDDEDSKAGNKDVVDLGGAILQRQRDVVQKVIVGSGKLAAQGFRYQFFTPVLIPRCAASGKGEPNSECQADTKGDEKVGKGWHWLFCAAKRYC